MTITLRTVKGLPLTYEEMDGNFSDLDTRISTIEAANVTSVNDQTGAVTLSTTDINEGTNLYYTTSRFDTRLASKSTSDIAEGTNLYLTAARVRGNISAGTGLTYSSATGVMSLSGNTNVVSEGSTNLYFTNARVDSRIATTNADALADIVYPSTPNNGEVLMWNSADVRWEPQLPPGAAGGETNTASNRGTGQGLFAAKAGADLQFYSLAVGTGMTISAPASNVITISNDQDLTTTGNPTFNAVEMTTSANIGNTQITNNTLTSATTNANLSISGNGTGYVNVNGGAGLSVASGNLVSPNIITLSNANLNLTPNGTGQVIIANAVVSTLTSGRVTYATTNKTLTDNANLTFDGSTLTITGTVTATAVNAGNIRSTVDTITSLATNGNINITATGTGSVIANTLKISDLTSTRITYASASGQLVDNANLTFSGTTLTVTGTANVTTLNASNLKLYNNHVESLNTNGNIYLNPDGTGRVSIGNKASPAYLLDVNGTFGANSVTTSGNITVGNSLSVGSSATTDTITLTARIASSPTPNTTNSHDLGTASLKWRNAYLSGTLSVDGSITLGDSSSDTLSLNATVSNDILPTTTGANDLGSSSLKWKDLYLSGDITFGGGDIISTAATANLVNATATTVNFAGAATSLTMGSASAGNLVIQNPITVHGNGTTSATPAAATIKGTNGSGTNIAAANLTLEAGAGTGTGVGGKLVFAYAPPGGTGSAVNAYVTKMYINDDINSTADILPTANATYNLGSTSLRWNNLWGVSSSALYADLAERYEADAEYDEGTVVVFGGDKEITTSATFADTAVAGVVSMKPAYVMNDDGQDPKQWPAVALRGKVPVKVKGKVAKGDLLVASDVKGYAVSVGKVDHGASVIAKAIADKDTEELGMIIAVVI